MIYKSVEQTIGKTPLIECCRIEKKLGLKARLLVKAECYNPAGSAKDRAALYMINDAEAAGLLKPGSTIIEETSGNTGIGLCSVAAQRGYKVVIVMPSNMSQERIKTMQAYGAEVILTPAELGMMGAMDKVDELRSSIPDSWVAGQFVNPSNSKAHFETTGPEIWKDAEGNVDIFVAGVGTGGTITGTGKYLKSKKPSIKVVAVEPAGSPVLSGGKPGPHNLQGIGGGFVPDILDTEIYDEIITCKEEDAYRLGRMMATEEGLLVGISSGAALWAAAELAQREENEGKTIVALLTDTGMRYLSTELFE